MLVSVVPIGNSKGIRIPKSILQQLNIEEKVELEVHNTEILIRPIKKKPREGWPEEFMKMHKNGDDSLFLDNLNEQDDFEWEW
ncbi:MAG: AbrB/MazE/SpoVT family DNA-binding domain-containing protein [Spirochaetia bacterium]|nr:AbrB/MazE/SpoVT family DNA-binding domain-containing protein [Spirochaetia bacterium]